MRATVCVMTALLFVASFCVVYLLFRHADPQTKAVIGAMLFMVPAVLLLGGDLVRSSRLDRRATSRMRVWGAKRAAL
jgi:hypothetical protein